MTLQQSQLKQQAHQLVLTIDSQKQMLETLNNEISKMKSQNLGDLKLEWDRL